MIFLTFQGPYQASDKAGRPACVFSACVHSSVLRTCDDDPDNYKLFIIQLAIEWVQEKHTISLDHQYSLPRLSSKGEMVAHLVNRAPRHGIAHIDRTPVYSRNVPFPLLTYKENCISIDMPKMPDAADCHLHIDYSGLLLEWQGVYRLQLDGDFSNCKEAVFDRSSRTMTIDF